MAVTIIKEIAAQFTLTEEQVVTEGMKAFLYDQLHLFEAEHQFILAKYNVNSCAELDSFMTSHPDQESDILPDLQRLDFLASRLKEIKKLLGELHGNGQS
ncbi:hypothetical protein KJ068_02750 [bacterium]|nr:hypothetical protein [bacterium]